MTPRLTLNFHSYCFIVLIYFKSNYSNSTQLKQNMLNIFIFKPNFTFLIKSLFKKFKQNVCLNKYRYNININQEISQIIIINDNL